LVVTTLSIPQVLLTHISRRARRAVHRAVDTERVRVTQTFSGRVECHVSSLSIAVGRAWVRGVQVRKCFFDDTELVLRIVLAHAGAVVCVYVSFADVLHGGGGGVEQAVV
jgi:hypothetical protein